MITCPCCGQTIETRAPIDALQHARLPAVPRRIVMLLSEIYPRPATPDFLIEEIYRGTREPDTARAALSVQMNRLRDKLAIHGWTVSQGKPGRGNTSLYRLEELP